MLRSLEIRDMLIVDRLEIEPGPGLNALTGETGAGKSILLDNLGFVLGWRGRADMVRAGQDQGEVVAVFDIGPDHPARAVLAEAGIEAEDELILRRVNRADGRKSAWVNDRRVSGEVLRALSETLVELHGQQDDRGLLNTRLHRQMLDAFGGLESPIAAVRDSWRKVRALQADLDAAREALAKVAAEEDFLRHAVAELDALDPQPGEEAELDARRRRMQATDKVREDIVRAHHLLGPGDGAEGQMGEALRWLEGAEAHLGEALHDPVARVSQALDRLADASAGVEALLAALEFNPAELDQTEERLFALRGLARKHAVLPDELGAFADVLRGRLAALDQGEGEIAAKEAALHAARAEYDRRAQALRAARTEAAARLDAAMRAELVPLKMDRAQFITRVEPAEPGPEGVDSVTFTIAPNPGVPPGPLNKIASGGELSRFLLALKVCLTGARPGLTLIFDEIDRGVGGATADAVGRRLEALAQGGQVLVVTHSPQVAARAAHHWQVSKRVEEGATLSTVTVLDAEARVDEIARMLAGDIVTDEARAAARALLAG
ncbi:MAG TPA: DNA repair protein RecN [Aliiroseovarius sp.]|nr:DNA repair protein RecN [Aliiroseovarius sp.]